MPEPHAGRGQGRRSVLARGHRAVAALRVGAATELRLAAHVQNGDGGPQAGLAGVGRLAARQVQHGLTGLRGAITGHCGVRDGGDSRCSGGGADGADGGGAVSVPIAAVP